MVYAWGENNNVDMHEELDPTEIINVYGDGVGSMSWDMYMPSDRNTTTTVAWIFQLEIEMRPLRWSDRPSDALRAASLSAAWYVDEAAHTHMILHIITDSSLLHDYVSSDHRFSYVVESVPSSANGRVGRTPRFPVPVAIDVYVSIRDI
jgi:hypothetical protein